MTLKLYNTLTRKKEDFKPIDPKRVTMYNCGPTVYSYAHIGNARAAVAADVLFRVLRHIYGEEHVVYARNITDVEDKINAAAAEQGVEISVITEKFAKIYNDDLAALGCLPPTLQPKATEHMDEMIAMISKLMDDGYAYGSEGHVFFDISKYDDYGKLSGNTLDQLRKGERVDVEEYARKKNAADFVLWKPSKQDEPVWKAPFGNGRPGWHIECSAMIEKNLGTTIDIHCGGQDLKFPHHENEIAQSNCAHGAPLANFWVHNGFLQMDSTKMSKSLGNVKLIHELLETWDGEVLRFALLYGHYRSELDWTDDLLKQSKATLDGWYRVLADTSFAGQVDVNLEAFLDNILDDLNTPKMLSGMSGFKAVLTHQDKTSIHVEGIRKFRGSLIGTANLLGLLTKDPEEWFRAGLDYDGLVAEYDTVREQALAAKQAGDKAKMGELFKRSDDIRNQFKANGVIIESGPDGKSTWRKG